LPGACHHLGPTVNEVTFKLWRSQPIVDNPCERLNISLTHLNDSRCLHQHAALWYIDNMNAEELFGIIHSDPEIMGGTPVFVGTRVPLQNLIDYLEGGESVEDFLEAFPSVKREQAISVIEAGRIKMLETV
jgi:uncharacterized protein (DUF433 family)